MEHQAELHNDKPQPDGVDEPPTEFLGSKLWGVAGNV